MFFSYFLDFVVKTCQFLKFYDWHLLSISVSQRAFVNIALKWPHSADYETLEIQKYVRNFRKSHCLGRLGWKDNIMDFLFLQAITAIRSQEIHKFEYFVEQK